MTAGVRGLGRRRIVLLAAATMLAGCGDQAADETSANAAGVERRVVDGDVSLVVRVEPDHALVGDPIDLRVEVVAPDGFDVAMPRPEDQTLGPFTIVEQRRPPDVPDGTRRRWRHEYTLETFESGTLEVPALTIRYTDRRDDPGDGTVADARELSTGPVAVEVGSVLAGEAEPTLRDIRGFVELPSAVPWWWWVLAAAGIAVAVVAVIAALRLGRRRRDEAAATPVAPDAWARAELDRLEREQLPEQGEVHAFFFRLSDIVRRYIERRFGLDAPDRTTEEFIREMRRHPVLDEGHQRLLGTFLRSADMVKFALHRPPVEECRNAMASARAFVEQTAPREVDQDVQAEGGAAA